jgi:ESCRT-I complex subunit TSG101
MPTGHGAGHHMPPHRDSTLQLLRSTFQYPADSEQALVDQMSIVLRAVPSLSPGVDTYTSNTGASQRLVHLSGTIPLDYRGAMYNIPIRIWIMSGVPRSGPPIVFVTPTRSMLIKSNHRHVNAEGRVFLPELSSWNAVTSTLRQIVQKMTLVFSQDPPVFARPVASLGAQPVVTQQAHAPRTYMTTDAHEHELREQLICQLSDRTTRHLAEADKKHLETLAAIRREAADAQFTEAMLVEALKHFTVMDDTASAELKSLRKQHQAVRDSIATNNVANGDIAVDEVIRISDVLSGQIVECGIRDNVCQDMLESLVDGIENDRIDINVFMRETRRISIEQFNARAMQIKVCFVNARKYILCAAACLLFAALFLLP